MSERFEVRPARPEEDAAGLARVRVDTWRDAYAGLLPPELLADQSYERSASAFRTRLSDPEETARCLVAASKEEGVVGFALFGPERDGHPVYTAEVYALYVLPDFQGLGLGRRLVQACAQLLLQDGHEKLLIWTLRDNPARRFYDSIGGQVTAERDKLIGGLVPMAEVGYGFSISPGWLLSLVRQQP